MEYDVTEARRRREYEAAIAAKRKAEERLAEINRKARNAKTRLLSTTRSEQWHRMSLAWLERDAGYTGEMASARVWLRHQPLDAYIALVAPFAAEPGAASLAAEVAAVRANLTEWTKRGEALLLNRARRAYDEDVASFRVWQRDHPDNRSWRRKQMTRSQGFLIGRMAATLDVEPPIRMNRGEAHDWIEAHGGNPRLMGSPPNPVTPSGPGSVIVDVAAASIKEPASASNGLPFNGRLKEGGEA
jgi:hypothetical protein